MSDMLVVMQFLSPFIVMAVGLCAVVWSLLKLRRTQSVGYFVVAGIGSIAITIAGWKLANFKVTGKCTQICEKIKARESLDQDEKDLLSRCPACDSSP